MDLLQLQTIEVRMSQLNRTTMIQDLSEDLLSRIFSNLDEREDLYSTTLVCKLFCSLSSPLIRKLTFLIPFFTYFHYMRLLKRFSGVKKICIRLSDLDDALLAISHSALNLEKLKLTHSFLAPRYPEAATIEIMSTSSVIKSIKSLELNWFDGTTSKKQVVDFVKMFPSLTKLSIRDGYKWNDKLIHKVTSNLPNLLKIDISLSENEDLTDEFTDEILDILSSNCPKLENVNFRECWFSHEPLYRFFCNNPQLRSVHMPMCNTWSISQVVDCLQVLENVDSLFLETLAVRDVVLIALAERQPRLKRLQIGYSSSKKYTMAGLSQLLSKCPDLERLDIHLPCPHHKRKNCVTHDLDLEMSIVVKGLPNLKHITVWSRVVCQATLFSLVQNCPQLETILFKSDNHQREGYCDNGMTKPTKKNYTIKSIRIDHSSEFWLLPMVKPYCPNLKEHVNDDDGYDNDDIFGM